jgi:hypothetical protein
MPNVTTPSWACPQWGHYEHDWLDCPDCLAAYERFMEESASPPDSSGDPPPS